MKQLTTLTAFGTLTSSLLGGSSLSLPYAFSHSGVTLGILAIIVLSTLTSISCNLIYLSAKKAGVNSLDEVAKSAYGRRGSIASVTIVFLFTMLASVAYIMMIAEHVIEVFPFKKDDDNEVKDKSNIPLMKFVVALLTFPLTTIRNIKGLRYTSMISVLFMVLLLFLIGIRSIQKGEGIHRHDDDDDDDDKEEKNDKIHWWANNFDQVAYSTSFFMSVFQCQFQVIPIYNEISSSASMPKAINYTMVFVACLYLYVGILGYLYALDRTCDTILHTFDADDDLAQACRVFLCISLIFSYPLTFLAFRSSFVQLLIQTDRLPSDAISTSGRINQMEQALLPSAVENAPDREQALAGVNENESGSNDPSVQLVNKYHYIFTTTLVLVVLIIALILPTIGFIWGILGSTLGVAICFFLPSLFYLRLHQESITKNQKVGLILLMVFGGLICLAGLISTLAHADDPSCPDE